MYNFMKNVLSFGEEFWWDLSRWLGLNGGMHDDMELVRGRRLERRRPCAQLVLGVGALLGSCGRLR